MDRVRAEREANVASSRAQRREIVTQEANNLQCLGEEEPPQLSVEEMNGLIEELETELDKEKRERELQMLRDLEEIIRDRDDDVQELVEGYGRGAVEGGVICPVCERNSLCVRDGVVFCRCGLRLDGGTYDQLTLEMVRQRLLEVIAEHGQRGCYRRRPPTFACKERFGFTFMHAYCDACDLDCIVL